MKILYNTLGWYGTLAIISAYFLNSFGIIEASSLAYQLLNATGAIGAILIGYYEKVWQSVSLNLVWLLIGIVAIVKMFM